jgi:predicted Rdx family selenoprotein
VERGIAAPGDVELINGAIGEFTITIDGRVAFDKAMSGRFPTDEDIDGLA